MMKNIDPPSFIFPYKELSRSVTVLTKSKWSEWWSQKMRRDHDYRHKLVGGWQKGQMEEHDRDGLSNLEDDLQGTWLVKTSNQSWESTETSAWQYWEKKYTQWQIQDWSS